MKKITGTIKFEYMFDNSRSGSKYTLNGKNYMNGGEFAEIVAKSARNCDLVKDANTRFDMGSDIETTCTSVKSSKATLTSVQMGNTFEEIQKSYFDRVYSNNWDWVVVIENEYTIYNMNKAEFKEFMNEWGCYYKNRNVIRFKATSCKMIKWLEERV